MTESAEMTLCTYRRYKSWNILTSKWTFEFLYQAVLNLVDLVFLSVYFFNNPARLSFNSPVAEF